MIIRTLFTLATLACSLTVVAATAHAQTPRAGEYILDGGRGHLVVQPANASGVAAFKINTVGGNYHVCSVEGEMRAGRAEIRERPNEAACVISFKAMGEHVTISADESGDPCNQYCGMRARFSGLYLRPPAGCAGTEQQKTRDAFKRAYDRRAYAEARTLLAPVLERCARQLPLQSQYSIRNDLAVTLHHLREHDACRAVLAPLAVLAKSSDEQLRDNYPPAEAPEFIELARAARTNFKLCGAPVR